MDQYRTYKIEDSGGVAKYLAVVVGAAEGGVKKPAAADAGKCVGITQEAQATQNKSVRVKRSGYSFATASAAIAFGDAVGIAGTTGKLKSVQTDMAAAPGTAKVVNVVGYAETAAGADGDLFEIFVQPFTVKTAAS